MVLEELPSLSKVKIDVANIHRIIMMSYKLIQPAVNIGIGTANLVTTIVVYLQYRCELVLVSKQLLLLSCSQCFFSMELASCKNKFMSQINSSFGSGGMSLAMNDLQFAAFLLHIKSNQQDMPIGKATCAIRQQPCGNV